MPAAHSSITVRHAEPDDLPAIVEIYNASIPGRMATADTHAVSVESSRAWFDQRDPSRRPLYVAQIGNHVAGYLRLRDFYGRPAYHATAEVGLYVHPDFQRRGVGRTLVAHVIKDAPSLGLTTLLAFTFAHNEPSLRLFESFGFERWGLLPGIAEMDGRTYDLVLSGRAV